MKSPIGSTLLIITTKFCLTALIVSHRTRVNPKSNPIISEGIKLSLTRHPVVAAYRGIHTFHRHLQVTPRPVDRPLTWTLPRMLYHYQSVIGE